MKERPKRVCIIVMDSLGLGALPDAGEYGDEGTDTLGHILDRAGLEIPHLQTLGMGNITCAAGGRLRIDGNRIEGAFGRFREQSKGKDTITGHWEIAGLYHPVAFRSFPDGFPREIMDEFVRRTGHGYIGNRNTSGTEIIKELGEEHERTGKLIVYTSADSVFQIAANTSVVPLDELYRVCEVTRDMMRGEWACGRVIARPYIIDGDGSRTRTADRRDYALDPPGKTMLDILSEEGQRVHAIGKISDIFNGKGVTTAIHTESNDDGVTKTIEALKEDFGGLIFTNLVDFDSKYGHRRDPEGYARAIEAFDGRLPEIRAAMKEDDLLIICSDHGNDPIHVGFNHTREHIFGLFCGAGAAAGVDLGTRESFADIGATVIDHLTEGRRTTAFGRSMREALWGAK